MIRAIMAIRAYNKANNAMRYRFAAAAPERVNRREKKLNKPILCENGGTEIPPPAANGKAKEKQAKTDTE